MADEKKKSRWEEIKKLLTKSTVSKSEDDEDPDETSAEDQTNEDDDDEDEYEDASVVVKALTDKIVNLEETIETMAKAQTAMLEKMEEADVLQKSIGQGILAVMDRTEEVLASPKPRQAAVTALEATLAKSQAAGAAGGGGDVGGRMKPFTRESFDFTKDILIKAVSDGEISTEICAGYETQMNKSIGRTVYPFTDDFVAFMKKHVA